MISTARIGQQYRTLWGEPVRTAHFERGRYAIDIWKWDVAATSEGVTIYATVGASQWRAPTNGIDHRVEFFIGLHPERDEIASPLAALGLYAVEHRTTLDHGHTVPAGGPLWPGTAMDTLLILRPREPVVPALDLAEEAHVEFMQVVPLYPSEVAYKATHNAELLLERWAGSQVPFWNPDRKAEPAA